MLSRVGDDEDGRELSANLDRLGIDRSFVQIDPSRPTGTVSVALDGERKPTYSIPENVAWDRIGYSPELTELAQKADAVCFGTLAQRSPVSRASIRRFLAATRSVCLRIFDINLRLHFYDAETIVRSLQLANVFKLNDEELRTVAGMLGIADEEQSMIDQLRKTYDLDLVALTRGASGSLLISRDGSSFQAAIPADVVDTVGAGDAFTAALALGILHRDELNAINLQACRLASYVCSRSGAMPAPPQPCLSSNHLPP